MTVCQERMLGSSCQRITLHTLRDGNEIRLLGLLLLLTLTVSGIYWV